MILALQRVESWWLDGRRERRRGGGGEKAPSGRSRGFSIDMQAMSHQIISLMSCPTWPSKPPHVPGMRKGSTPITHPKSEDCKLPASSASNRLVPSPVFCGDTVYEAIGWLVARDPAAARPLPLC